MVRWRSGAYDSGEVAVRVGASPPPDFPGRRGGRRVGASRSGARARRLGGLLNLALLVASAAVWLDTSSNAQTVGEDADSTKAGGQKPAAASRCTRPLSPDEDEIANLARYREANARLGRVSVVFMGDSITEFWDVSGFLSRERYVNRGIAGQTTRQMLLRFCQDVVLLEPRVVVILAGTNDIAGNLGPVKNEEIENNLAAMSGLAQEAGIRVVLASITPVGATQTGQRPISRIRSINAWLRSYTAGENLPYLDYYSKMADSGGLLQAELSNDGLHPNAKGYEVMRPLAEAAIATALADAGLGESNPRSGPHPTASPAAARGP